jgi:hypothetical protein
MKDTDDTMTDQPENPRDVLANLFTPSHPNIAWAIRRAPTYKKALNANTTYADLISHTSEFLDNIEMGFDLMASTNTANEQRIASNEQTIIALQQSNQALNALVASLESAPRVTTATSAQPKRKAKDPPVFDGKGSPVERQEKFEIWETKIQNIFQRDADCFPTPLDEVLYMSEMLVDKAYDYVKHGLDMLRQNQPAKFVFYDRESMFEYMRKHYKTIDTSQVAKNKLDTLTQGERNYWSWKAELDELMIKAHKTEEQKVDLLKKHMSPKMKDLAITLSRKIGEGDYEGWSDQMDVFALNLQDHNHQAKLSNSKPSGYRPGNQPGITAPMPVGEPMDLDRISDNERKRRVDNKLCLACGQSGHWKEAHDPNRTANPIPMPARQTTSPPNRGNLGLPRGRGLNYGRGGRGNTNFTGSPAPVTPYMGGPSYNKLQQQWRMRLAEPYEPGYVIDEDLSSTTNDSTSRSDLVPPRQDSPAPQSLKGQPLD